MPSSMQKREPRYEEMAEERESTHEVSEMKYRRTPGLSFDFAALRPG